MRRIHPDLAQVHLRLAHRELRAAWRAGTLPHWRLVLGPLLVIGLLGSALPGPWRWIAGLTSGLGLALWLVLGDRLARLERWRTRIGSVHLTLRVVDRLLAEGWSASADEGLALVGPGGVYVVESVSWSGRVEVVGGVPVRTFADDPDGAVAMTGLPDRVRRLAGERAELLGSSGIHVTVTPVVVIWGEFAAGACVDTGVAYLRGDELAGWLSARCPSHRSDPEVLAAVA